MSKKSSQKISDYTLDSNDQEFRLTEKEVKVMQLTNHLNELKNSNEKEIAKLWTNSMWPMRKFSV